MSRNLCRVSCCFCPGVPTLDEKPRPITKSDAGFNFFEYEGMLVANATCPVCEAEYLAWVDESTRVRMTKRARERPNPDVAYVDLSFRSTFDDEPGERDLPKWTVETTSRRVGPWNPRGEVRPTGWHWNYQKTCTLVAILGVLGGVVTIRALFTLQAAVLIFAALVGLGALVMGLGYARME